MIILVKKKALIIDNLYHKYNKQDSSDWILNSINLQIENGELLGLLGPSGCGKTTLLRLIAGFEYPSKGKITLNNQEISNNQKILSFIFRWCFTNFHILHLCNGINSIM